MNGAIHGGWGYVWTAYGVTALMLIGYAVSVWLRLRAERRRLAEDTPGMQ